MMDVCCLFLCFIVFYDDLKIHINVSFLLSNSWHNQMEIYIIAKELIIVRLIFLSYSFLKLI